MVGCPTRYAAKKSQTCVFQILAVVAIRFSNYRIVGYCKLVRCSDLEMYRLHRSGPR